MSEQLDMVIQQGADFEYLHEKEDISSALIDDITAVATLREGIGGSIIATWSTENGLISKSAHGSHIDFAITVPAATTAALAAPSSGVYDLDISYDGALGAWTVRHAEGAFYITPNV
jgi:hypothetical protein